MKNLKFALIGSLFLNILFSFMLHWSDSQTRQAIDLADEALELAKEYQTRYFDLLGMKNKDYYVPDTLDFRIYIPKESTRLPPLEKCQGTL